jgi:hypothetical protein
VERVVLVHGSVAGGGPTWAAQEPLADRWDLVVLNRPGFAPARPSTGSTSRSTPSSSRTSSAPARTSSATPPFPKLVVSAAHHEGFDAICDVLERRLGAERAVLPGAGHTAQRVPGFNELLEGFLRRASRPSTA